MLKRQNILLALLLFITYPSLSQSTSQRLDSLFSDLDQYHYIYGNVLVAEKGIPLYQHSFGYGNISDKIKNSSNTNFELASLSKVFTAVAVMQLVERHRLKLDDPVIKFLPDFPYPAITIRQLLSHTGGLPDFQIFDADHKEDKTRIMTNADIIPALKRLGKPLYQPGEKWSYSSPGIGLLALIVEKISGIGFPRYLKQHIFKPASMPHTYINDMTSPIQDTNRAIPYTLPAYYSSERVPADTIGRNMVFLHASGGVQGPGLLVSNSEDLLRFDQALYSGKLLNKNSLAEMFSPVKLSDGSYAKASHYPGKTFFGLGWFIMEDSLYGKIAFHSGYKPGTTTIFLRNLTHQQTVIILDNGGSPGINVSGVNALRLLNNETPEVIKSPLTFTYGRDLMKKGPDFATIHFQILKKDTLHYTMNAADWIAMGYELFRTDKTLQALETFRTGYMLFPEHSFLCQIYADILVKTGKKEEAILMYNRSLQINPGNKEAMKHLKEISATQ